MSNTTKMIYEGLVQRFQLHDAQVDGDVLRTQNGLIVRGQTGFYVYQWPETTKSAVKAFLDGAVVGLKAIRTRPSRA